MEPLHLPSEEEINAAYNKRKEAVVALFYETFLKMAERIQKIEDQIAKNNSNSGKPPSSDGLAKKPKSLLSVPCLLLKHGYRILVRFVLPTIN